MTLEHDDHAARIRWQDARADLLARARTVGYSRGRGTLTTTELDELREAADRYELEVRRYLNA